MEKLLSSQAKDWREGRRLRAFELKEQGWKQTEIADALGVTEGAVSQWMKRARQEGVQALRHCCESLAQLRVELRKAKERLRHKKHVILGCIRQPGFEV